MWLISQAAQGMPEWSSSWTHRFEPRVKILTAVVEGKTGLINGWIWWLFAQAASTFIDFSSREDLFGILKSQQHWNYCSNKLFISSQMSSLWITGQTGRSKIFEMVSNSKGPKIPQNQPEIPNNPNFIIQSRINPSPRHNLPNFLKWHLISAAPRPNR